MVVWPVYIGAALEGTTPPFSINEPQTLDYRRGQIDWHPATPEELKNGWGEVVGRAKILCTPGTYTHFAYFRHPHKSDAMGVMQMDHPTTFTELTILDVYPIVNTDLQLSKQLSGV